MKPDPNVHQGKVAPDDVRQRIEDAFRRIADMDARQILVEVNGSEVTLRGDVPLLAERNQAQESAWSAPGVMLVTNELTVRP